MAAPKIPVGTVIESQDGSHSIYDGKNFQPAAQGADGQWGLDHAALERLGMGGNGKGGTVSPEDSKQVSAMQTDFQNVDGLANTANDFMRKNAGAKTGGVLAIPGVTTVAKALEGSNSNLAAMDRDSNLMAVQQRAPGMRLTQMEFGKFLGAVPNVRSGFDQNMSNTKDINAARTVAAAKSSYYATYLNTHKTLAGADAGWLAFRSQHFDPQLTTYYHNPADNPGNSGNAMLKQRSAGARQPVQGGVTVDVFGRPVGGDE